MSERWARWSRASREEVTGAGSSTVLWRSQSSAPGDGVEVAVRVRLAGGCGHVVPVLRHHVVMVERLAGVIALPDGTLIRGRGLREPLPAGPLPDYGLYLGRASRSDRGGRRRRVLRNGARWQPDWTADWIDWPDFRTPRHDGLAAQAIEYAYRLARAGHNVEIACGGGTGRTGTVIACMTVLAGQPVADAVTWTRRHYRRRAVETPGHRRWIHWFATQARAPRR